MKSGGFAMNIEEKTDKPTTKKLRPPMEEFIIE